MKCKHCNGEFTAEEIEVWGVTIKESFCSDQCRESSAEKAKLSRQWHREATIWRQMAPLAHQMPDDMSNARKTAICERVHPFQGKTFLYLYGPTRSGKTWTAWRILRRFCMEGYSIGFIDAAAISAASFADSSAAIQEGMQADVLLLDDVDKAIMTQHFAQALFNIVNRRGADRRATIITANVSPADFKALFPNSGQFSAPIIGRIKESVHVEAIQC